MKGNISKQKRNRRLNHLKRVQAVQEAYQASYVEGLPTTVIWKKHINPVYHISLQTLREYLALPVALEIRRLENT